MNLTTRIAIATLLSISMLACSGADNGGTTSTSSPGVSEDDVTSRPTTANPFGSSASSDASSQALANPPMAAADSADWPPSTQQATGPAFVDGAFVAPARCVQFDADGPIDPSDVPMFGDDTDPTGVEAALLNGGSRSAPADAWVCPPGALPKTLVFGYYGNGDGIFGTIEDRSGRLSLVDQ